MATLFTTAPIFDSFEKALIDASENIDVITWQVTSISERPVSQRLDVIDVMALHRMSLL